MSQVRNSVALNQEQDAKSEPNVAPALRSG